LSVVKLIAKDGKVARVLFLWEDYKDYL
jgi:hypothetical protein